MDEGATRHSFLLQEGVWLATGECRDSKGRLFPVDGRAEIRHLSDVWLNSGTHCVRGKEPLEISSNYEIVPMAAGTDYTTWKLQNHFLGTLHGHFALTSEYILSLFTSADGRYSGTEQLLRIDDVTYRCRGILMAGTRRISSWSVYLIQGKPESQHRH